MNIKKLVLVSLLFSGILGCGCFNDGSEWNIESFTVSIFDKNGMQPTDGVIEGDSIVLEVFFEPEYVEFNANPLSGLMSSAIATTCEEPGDDGLNITVNSFLITSNADFNETPAGESLNEFIIVNGNLSLEEWIEISHRWGYQNYGRSGLTFIEKPGDSSSHIFILQFVMESGEIIEQKTEEIQWN